MTGAHRDPASPSHGGAYRSPLNLHQPTLHILRLGEPPQLRQGRPILGHHTTGGVHPGTGTGKNSGRRPISPAFQGSAPHGSRGNGVFLLPTDIRPIRPVDRDYGRDERPQLGSLDIGSQHHTRRVCSTVGGGTVPAGIPRHPVGASHRQHHIHHPAHPIGGDGPGHGGRPSPRTLSRFGDDCVRGGRNRPCSLSLTSFGASRTHQP